MAKPPDDCNPPLSAAARAPIEEPIAAAPEPEPVAPQPVPAPAQPSPVFTDGASSAVYDGFSELARKTAIDRAGITLEDVVRSELNPLLREWLDKNLPSIIERLVKQEIEKIAKRAETDSDGF